jgi:hypothetical protein
VRASRRRAARGAAGRRGIVAASIGRESLAVN